MSTWKTKLRGFSHRFAYAALISAFVWIFATQPFPGQVYPLGFGAQLIRWLDLPIATATQVLSCDDFAIDLWFTVEGGEPCPVNSGGLARYFVNHMRVGIPAYLLVFYLPVIFRASRAWWVRRRHHRPPVAAKR